MVCVRAGEVPVHGQRVRSVLRAVLCLITNGNCCHSCVLHFGSTVLASAPSQRRTGMVNASAVASSAFLALDLPTLRLLWENMCLGCISWVCNASPSQCPGSVSFMSVVPGSWNGLTGSLVRLQKGTGEADCEVQIRGLCFTEVSARCGTANFLWIGWIKVKNFYLPAGERKRITPMPWSMGAWTRTAEVRVRQREGKRMDNFPYSISASFKKTRTEVKTAEVSDRTKLLGYPPWGDSRLQGWGDSRLQGCDAFGLIECVWKHWCLPTWCSPNDRCKSWNSLLVPRVWCWDCCFDAERKTWSLTKDKHLSNNSFQRVCWFFFKILEVALTRLCVSPSNHACVSIS